MVHPTGDKQCAVVLLAKPGIGRTSARLLSEGNKIRINCRTRIANVNVAGRRRRKSSNCFHDACYTIFRLSYAPVMAIERLFLKSYCLLNECDIILSIRGFIAF